MRFLVPRSWFLVLERRWAVAVTKNREPGTRNRSSVPRTWRPMALWSAGLLLVLGLFGFAALIAAPLIQVTSELDRCLCAWDSRRDSSKEAIVRLGGTGEAARKITLFLKMPDWVTDSKRVADDSSREDHAIFMLGLCGRPGAEVLTPMLHSKHPRIRCLALMAIQDCGPDAVGALPAIEALLADGNPWIRAEARDALRSIRGSSPPGQLSQRIKP